MEFGNIGGVDSGDGIGVCLNLCMPKIVYNFVNHNSLIQKFF